MLHTQGPRGGSPTEALAPLAVKLFGPIADEFGRTLEVTIPAAGITVGGLRRLLAEAVGPAGEKFLSPAMKVCVDRVIAVDAVLVRPNPQQDVAVLPVFSGG